MKNMKKELWLEFGYMKDKNYGVGDKSYQDMCWYNEGRASELPYFIKNYIRWFFKKDVYFLWRYGRKNHYLKKSNLIPLNL